MCTKDKGGRTIKVSENFKQISDFRKKMKSVISKKIISKRKEIVEHPYGTIKRNFGFTYFMQRGVESVRSEFGFMAFIYNFKRVLNMYSTSELISKINHCYA